MRRPVSREFLDKELRQGGGASVEVCVVTYNSAATIERLIDSLAGEPSIAHIRVVDSGSSDGTPEIMEGLKRREARLSVFTADRNLGFPAGANLLLRQCTSDLVLLLNPDIEMRPGVVPYLSDVALADETVGVVTCQLRTRDGRAQSEPARPLPTLRRLLAANAPNAVRRLRPQGGSSSSRGLDDVKDVAVTMGALLLLRRAVLEDVGLLDESVFMYLEDLDLSARLRRKGYRIRYQGDVWVWHDSGVSSKGHEDALYALMPQVWLTYYHRYGTFSQRWFVRPTLLLICLAGLIAEMGLRRGGTKYRLALTQVLTYRPRNDLLW